MAFHSASPAMRKWGQGRLLEAEEEDYFNNSDDEETPKTNNAWPPLSPLGSVNTLKRKRGKGFTSLSAGPPSKQARPMALVKPRPTQSLVDYDEDEDAETSDRTPSSSKAEGPAIGKLGLTPLSPPRQIDWFADTQGLDDSASPAKSAHSASPSSSGSGSSSGSSSHSRDPISDQLTRPESPPRLGDKRRRSEDEDEDEMLERLVKSKKPSHGAPSPDKEDLKSPSPKPAAPGKMKLKLGATSFSLASSGGNPPDTAKKDVDSG